ncbi:alkene reductase [Celerinatantimonas yamalensis]|uniref:Alkene reductase n=1 Tax=Celerinatantimonas yamalensis TaxID=559956 RepID=A0ABW9G4H7_9GAMM
MSLDKLLSHYSLNGSLTLANHVVMAPLTRCFADEQLVPTAEMVAYYARRANVGLIITEATIIRKDGQGYPNTPGIFSDAQIQGWQHVTHAVHQHHGLIFSQLWHTGRVAHPAFFDPQGQVVAPSAIAAHGSVPRRRELTYQTPHALNEDEIAILVNDYAQAAKNARQAGFDGVEIHAANGYLIDQFLHYDSNRRDDNYGGDAKRMVRFALEVVDAISTAIGADRVGIRLSPLGYVNSITPDSRDRDVFDTLLEALNHRELAYVHAGLFDHATSSAIFDGNISHYLRSHSQHTYIAVGGFTPSSAEQGLVDEHFDLVAIGRPLIANPDYIDRLRADEALIDYHEQMLTSLD